MRAIRIGFLLGFLTSPLGVSGQVRTVEAQVTQDVGSVAALGVAAAVHTMSGLASLGAD